MLVGAPIMPYLPTLSKERKKKVWSLCNNSSWFFKLLLSCTLNLPLKNMMIDGNVQFNKYKHTIEIWLCEIVLHQNQMYFLLFDL